MRIFTVHALRYSTGMYELIAICNQKRQIYRETLVHSYVRCIPRLRRARKAIRASMDWYLL